MDRKSKITLLISELILVIALFYILTSGISHAQSYSSDQSKREMCRITGLGALLSYDNKQHGKPPPDMPKGTLYMAPLYQWAFDYGYNTAISAGDAERMGFAKCMDNIDHLTLAYKNGRELGPLR